MVVSATPVVTAPSQSQHSRKASATQIPSRPTTPLRSTSRTSLRASQTTPSATALPAGASSSTDRAASTAISNSTERGISHYGSSHIDFPLAALEPAFAELSDSMADLEANFMHLQLLNESVARFNENFAAFLYGLNMTAFCVDFSEAPIVQSFNRHGSNTCQLEQSPYRQNRLEPAEDQNAIGIQHDNAAHDATFLTTDTSFVVNPPSTAADSKSSAARGRTTSSASRRGTSSAVVGRGVNRGSSRGRGGPMVAGTDANGRRTTRLPAGSSRGSTRGVVRGRANAANTR